MIDPYSGETADRMTLMRTVLRPRVLWPRYLLLGSLGLSILFGVLGRTDVSSFFSSLFLVALLGASATSLIGRSLMVHVFLTRQTRSRQVLSYWLLLGTVVLLLSLMFLAANFSGAGDWILNVIAAASLVAIFAAIMIRWRQRRLYWRKGPDHRREMKGLHPRALELLAETVAGQRA
jgi:SNF family Na+-dependent transporter